MRSFAQFLRIANALMEYHYKIDTSKLSERQWGAKFNELIWIRENEANYNES